MAHFGSRHSHLSQPFGSGGHTRGSRSGGYNSFVSQKGETLIHTNMKRLVRIGAGALALAMLCFSTLQAQNSDPVVEKVIEMGKNDNRTMELTDILCNRFGGRLVGSDAYENASDWVEYMFKSWGLEVWRQEVGQMPVGFNRGPWFGRMLGGSGATL